MGFLGMLLLTFLFYTVYCGDFLPNQSMLLYQVAFKSWTVDFVTLDAMNLSQMLFFISFDLVRKYYCIVYLVLFSNILYTRKYV